MQPTNRATGHGEGSARGRDASEAPTIEQLDVRYEGQWVLLSVTRADEEGTPLAGRVIAHGTRGRVDKALSQIAAAGERPEEPLYVFAAGAFVRRGAMWRKGAMEAPRPKGPRSA